MADEPANTDQQDVEELLRQATKDATGDSVAGPLGDSGIGAAGKPFADATYDDSEQVNVETDDMEALLEHARQSLESVDQPVAATAPGVQSFELSNLLAATASTDQATLDLVRDVEFDLKIELGRTSMLLEDVLRLSKGSVVALDKLAGDPVDIYVNGRLIARGEVLVLNDNFCVRVAELIAGSEAESS